MQWKIKPRPTDKLWTDYLRLRDKNICFWCGNKIFNKRNSGVSHYWNRTKESTRYEDDNCDLMCNIPCHQKAEHEKKIKGFDGAEYDGEYTKKKKNQLGKKRFNELMVLAHTTKKRDDKMDKIILEAKLNDHQNKN